MLTPQEVANKSFTKSMMGGYSMPMVDEFLDELTEDYSSLYKENTALKAKLKVLVEKVEEYRGTEDSMRAALFTAQEMADEILADAKKKGVEIVEAAREEAQKEVARIRTEVEAERRRLSAAQEETASFVTEWQELRAKQMEMISSFTTECESSYQRYGEFLDKLPELSLAEKNNPSSPEKKAKETSTSAKGAEKGKEDLSMEERIQSILRTTVAEVSDEEKKKAENAASENANEAEANVPSKEELDDLFGTRTFRLDELRFDRNYDDKPVASEK